MNRHEAHVWVEYHKEVFPDWAAWYGSGKEQKAARAVMFEAIVKALRDLELADAKAATDGMLAGDPKRPFHGEDHLATIIRAASMIREERRRETRPKPADGQQTFGCPHCLDTGIVEIPRKDTTPSAAVCACPAGDKHTGRPWGSPHAKPDPSMPRYDPSKSHAANAPNYEPAFQQPEAF